MQAPTFDELRREVFRLHGEEDYQAALDALERDWRSFPDQEPSVYFWRMCLWSRVGDVPRVLELFDEALAKGYWWDPSFLDDPDLGAARTHAGWSDRAGESELRRRAAAAGPLPAPIVATPDGEPAGVLLVLHGFGSAPSQHAAEWQPAAGRGWAVVTPFGSRPVGAGQWAWDPDRDPVNVVDRLGAALAGLPQVPLVLAGFSMGAGLACRLAYEGALPASGVLAVAPSFGHFGMAWPGSPALRRVPTYVVVGGRDWGIEAVRDYAPVLRRAGWPVQVEEHADAHHEFPPDFPGVMARALAWLDEAAEGP